MVKINARRSRQLSSEITSHLATVGACAYARQTRELAAACSCSLFLIFEESMAVETAYKVPQLSAETFANVKSLLRILILASIAGAGAWFGI